ncbi:MAG: hypothetical protein ACI4BH_04390 [Muribaculaceae bacterium]
MKNLLLSIMAFFALSFMSCEEDGYGCKFYPFSTDFPEDGMIIGAEEAHIEISSTTKQPDGSVCPMRIQIGGGYKQYSYGDYDYVDGEWFKISCNRHTGWCYVDIKPNESREERIMAFLLYGKGNKLPKGYDGWNAQLIKITQKAD